MNMIDPKDYDNQFSRLIADYERDIVGTGFMNYVKVYYLDDRTEFIKYITNYIESANKPNRLNYLFDVYGLPTDMTLKERICYFQLLES